MAITFDLLDRFQENILFQTAQIVGWNYKDIGLSPAKFGAVLFSADLDPLGILIKNPPDARLEPLRNLRNPRWRPRWPPIH